MQFLLLVLSVFSTVHTEEVDTGAICDACMKYILKLHDYIIENLIDKFEQFLNINICQHLPQSLAQTCIETLGTEAERLREEVNVTFDNERFCTEKVCLYVLLFLDHF